MWCVWDVARSADCVALALGQKIMASAVVPEAGPGWPAPTPTTFRDIVNQCNSFLLPTSSRAQCRPFRIDGVHVGFIRYVQACHGGTLRSRR